MNKQDDSAVLEVGLGEKSEEKSGEAEEEKPIDFSKLFYSTKLNHAQGYIAPTIKRGKYAPDYRKMNVYRWEWGYKSPEMGRLGVIDLCEKVCTDYDIPQVRLVFKNTGKQAQYWGGTHQVLIPIKWAATAKVVLHELAHAIVYIRTAISGERYEAHGPEFVATMIELWARYDGGNQKELTEAARMKYLVG